VNSELFLNPSSAKVLISPSFIVASPNEYIKPFSKFPNDKINTYSPVVTQKSNPSRIAGIY